MRKKHRFEAFVIRWSRCYCSAHLLSEHQCDPMRPQSLEFIPNMNTFHWLTRNICTSKYKESKSEQSENHFFLALWLCDTNLRTGYSGYIYILMSTVNLVRSINTSWKPFLFYTETQPLTHKSDDELLSMLTFSALCLTIETKNKIQRQHKSLTIILSVCILVSESHLLQRSTSSILHWYW